MATVKGDIHDIGKNIVKVLLENYGYEVVDLGRDVPVETVVEQAMRQKVKLVGLSALMTTTVVSMEQTIRALREAGYTGRVMVGGAVLTPGICGPESRADDYAAETCRRRWRLRAMCLGRGERTQSALPGSREGAFLVGGG